MSTSASSPTSKNNNLSDLGVQLPRYQGGAPGNAPGLDGADLLARSLALEAAVPGRQVVVTCIDYSPDQVCAVDILDVEDFLSQHRPDWSVVRWINIDGLTDMKVLRAITEKYQIHPLAVEDMLHPGARPKAETYPGNAEHHARLFMVARMIQLQQQNLFCEQISFCLGQNTLLTFQETRGDIWDPVRERICKDGSRVRQHDVSFLLYTLMDAIVDQCFPVLDHYSDKLEELELEVLHHPAPHLFKRIHHLKRELLLLRREFWPMRELIHSLQRQDHDNLSSPTCVFMRDVYDHSVQVIDLMETYREVVSTLAETYMSATSHRMNQVMKVLTVIATIFMPLSFLAGVFGMNFKQMPEMEVPGSYPWVYPIGFWMLCGGIIVGMFTVFKRNQWL